MYKDYLKFANRAVVIKGIVHETTISPGSLLISKRKISGGEYVSECFISVHVSAKIISYSS